MCAVNEKAKAVNMKEDKKRNTKKHASDLR